tara:strand:+ start:1894 stop:2076 length:183 start_codon:yes stop_codon:yes gene_type:complete
MLIFQYPSYHEDIMHRGGYLFVRGVCKLDIHDGTELNPFFVSNARILMRHIGATERPVRG